MSEVLYRFEIDDSTFKATMAATKKLLDDVQVAQFAKRVRVPLSGHVAQFYSWLDARHRARVEREAERRFESGVWS